MSSRRRIITLAIAAVIAGFACSVAQAADPREFTTIEGRFDVGGHKLYLRCEGSGPGPTVVYFHGSIEDGRGGAISAAGIPSIVREKRRICVYDRANLGDSDKVKGPITGRQIVADLHALLRAAGVKPPYVLLGASFGGVLAYNYAATHPKQVKGMLLLDAGFPGELPLDPLYPPEDRFTHDDWDDGAEKIDFLDVYELSVKLESRGRLRIPVTYLLAMPSEWKGAPPAVASVIFDRIGDFVHSFEPGLVKRVKSPHYMEAAVPERIARELEILIKKIR